MKMIRVRPIKLMSMESPRPGKGKLLRFTKRKKKRKAKPVSIIGAFARPRKLKEFKMKLYKRR